MSGNSWITEYDNVDKNMIELVERKLGVIFPNDYLQVVINYQGGTPISNKLMINKNIEVELKYLLAFIAFDELDILDRFNELKYYLPKNVIPFAITSEQNVICFRFSEDKGVDKILYIDVNKGKSVKEKYVYEICNSFEELISKLF